MTVTHNRDEILSRANRFAKEFADAQYEMGEAQDFIRGLCDVFGFSNKRLVSFEHRVKKLDGRRGRTAPHAGSLTGNRDECVCKRKKGWKRPEKSPLAIFTGVIDGGASTAGTDPFLSSSQTVS